MLHPKYARRAPCEFWGAVVGGVLGAAGAMDANSSAAASAREQMEFQQYNSNTAYRRAVADMKAAGLNPMLAYSQGGASVPGGAQYKPENVGAAAVSGAQQANMLNAQVEKTIAETDLLRAQRDATSQDVVKKGSEIEQIVASTAVAKATVKEIESRIHLQNNQAEALIQQVKESIAREDLAKVDTILRKASIAEARAMERFFSSDFGEANPLVKQILEVLRVVISGRKAQ